MERSHPAQAIMTGLEMRPEHRLQSVHEFFAQPSPSKPPPVSPQPEEPPNIGLLIIAGQFEGHYVPLSREPLKIGRDPARVSLVCSDALISGQHCQVTIVDQTAYIEDLDSSNGTWINDVVRLKPYQPQMLRCNDIISLAGCLVLKLIDRRDGEDAAATTEQQEIPFQDDLRLSETVDKRSNWFDRAFQLFREKRH